MIFIRHLFHLGLVTVLVASCADTLSANEYVGSENCASCHQQEYQDWLGSHHDLAMQHATQETVLGDFSEATFKYRGITSRFYKKNDEFWVQTDGPQGELQDFRIEFTFGVSPLQQYLVRFDDGRLQALSISWDSRPEEQGGQRWFHLYPDETVHSGDVLHWTRQSQNWNLQCAACHSTNLQKNYTVSSNSYQTTWAEIDVACEACHGPGEIHLEWIKNPGARYENSGFSRDLSVTSRWLMEEGHSTLINADINKGGSQIQVCASCHSRRALISQHPKDDLLDHLIPAHIEPGLYYDDGQILDEVYVYGSFSQSKMYEQGVTCTNCHNPHSLELIAPGNSLCAQCHSPAVYDSPDHHHHPIDSTGALCVNCHMPETTYMVIDPRRDHSLRIPRPELTLEFGIPNACNQCHTDQDAVWAQKSYLQWYGNNLDRGHPVFAFHTSSENPPEATHLLQNIIFDDNQPLMIRASAVSRMSTAPSQDSIGTAIRMLESEDSLVRFSALGLLEVIPIEQRAAVLWPLLDDPVLAVRIESARLLAGYQATNKVDQTKLQQRLNEYEESILINADTSGGQSQLGNFYQQLGQFTDAQQAYQHAILLEPMYVPARLNLADMYRQAGRDELAMSTLHQGLKLLPEQPDLNFAAGLAYVRNQQLPTAERYLRIASEQAPDNPRYTYVHAVALFEIDAKDEAIVALRKALEQHPNDANMLNALTSYLQTMGRLEEATEYQRRLENITR